MPMDYQRPISDFVEIGGTLMLMNADGLAAEHQVIGLMGDDQPWGAIVLSPNGEQFIIDISAYVTVH
ncbi:MAG TPA: hypothetical protein DCZ12_02405 [Gammaproteobacteria bacterium]|nr:hypothetical protein [Gammaproteobacteria bacterium]